MEKRVNIFKTIFIVVLGAAMAAPAFAAGYIAENAGIGDVRLSHGFWFDRVETNRVVTLKACIEKCRETPRIANFTNAAARAIGTFGGIPFDDSDVYKVVEGASYVYATSRDAKLKEWIDWFAEQAAGAQEPDGYLYTARTLGYDKLNGTNEIWRVKMMGPDRWSRVRDSHELYNVGHMYEAACAWHAASGESNLLAVATRSADLVGRVFGPGPTQLKDSAGHEEIELALVKLAAATGESRYLDLAAHFVGVKGRYGNTGEYAQNAAPFVEQREAVGHAVRAAYLYCAAADLAAMKGDEAVREAVMAIWRNVVGRKLHLNGGIGATSKGEAFGADYYLPNKTAYLETCAAIGNVLWNNRMFRLTGDSKFVDVMERALYNNCVSGVSLAGSEFFYLNPLAAQKGYVRESWFGCSCCPVNIVRFMPQVPSFAYATDGRRVWWNLFMAGTAKICGAELSVETDYPWNGVARMKVVSAERPFALKVRIPGWARGRPVPSDLYAQTSPSSANDVKLLVNGRPVPSSPGEDGYATVDSVKAGDEIAIDIPMEPKRIRAHENVKEDKGRLAVEVGPVVYCAEGIDNGGQAYKAVVPEDATFEKAWFMVGDRPFVGLKTSNGLFLVPYCIWGNREPGNEMHCWFFLKPPPPPRKAAKEGVK